MDDKDPASRFDVFVSYNTSDHVAVERISRGLVERGLSVFIDRWELVPGQPWPEVLERHINDCRSVAVVLGPSGIGTWQHREQYLALDRQARDASFAVIPVLLPSADPALGFLALNTWVDLRADIDDPQALDLLAAATRGESPARVREESRRATDDVCPYRGLEVFREEDAPFFFGRETFTRHLLDQVSGRDFIAVVGASGSGKSSLIRAGLVPALRSGATDTVWDVLTLTPGTEPLAALARTLDPPLTGALFAAREQINAAVASLRTGSVTLQQLVADHLARQPGTDHLLLIIDQFEELATLAENAADASRFIDLLLGAADRGSRLTVLITLRSDFYTQIVQRRDLNDRLQDAVVQIGPLSQRAQDGQRSELESIICRPAEAVGLGFEDGLVQRIAADVGDEPGNLPLLEYLLTELWRQRQSGQLTHEAYDALGGVRGAITQRADKAYAELAPIEKRAARRLFLSLVRPGEGQQDTRAPAPFPSNDAEAKVARRFAGPNMRLLVTDKDALRGRFIQVSHEALIRSWSRLRDWIEQNRDTLRARERVRERMRRWREQGRPNDLLLPPGLELEEGRRLLQAENDVSIDDVRDYIQASISADTRRRRARRTLAGTIALVGLLLLALTGWQWRQADFARDSALIAERQARENAKQATSERDLAIAQQLNATATKVLEENPGETALAAMLAVESQARRTTPGANALLRDILQLTPLDAPPVDFPWRAAQIHFSTDGRVQVLGKRDYRNNHSDEAAAWSSVTVLKGTDLSALATRRFGGDMRPLISPDGRWLVSTGLGRRFVVTDLDSGEPVVDEPIRSAHFPVFSSDGATLYVARQTGVIEVRSAPDWTIGRQLAFPVDGARHAEVQLGISADVERLLVIDRRRNAYLVPTDGSAVTTLTIDIDELKPWFTSEHLSSGMVSPVEPVALTRQANGIGRLWDLASGRERLMFDDEGRSAASAFSPDGRMIATANSQGAVVLRRVTDGGMQQRWQHREDWDRDDDRINVLMFSADGRLLASAGNDGAVVVWRVTDGTRLHRFELDAPVIALAIDPADGSLLAGTRGGTLARLDLATRRLAAKQHFKGAVTRIATGREGGTIAIGVRETRSRSLWYDVSFVERASGRELSYFSFNGKLRSQRISPDGRWFAAYEHARKRVLVWATETGALLREIPGRAATVAFSRDSRRLLLHDGYGPLQVVDIADGGMRFQLGEPGGVNALIGEAFNDKAITYGVDRSLRGWDLATGATLWHTVPEEPDTNIKTSPDGGRFAYYADEEQAFRVFESASGRPIGSVRLAEPSRGVSLSDDGTRLLTISTPEDTDSNGNRPHVVEVWDVPTSTRLERRQIDARHVRVQAVDGPYFALIGAAFGNNRSTSWMELVEWQSGRAAWSLSAQHGASHYVKYIDRDSDRILIEGPISPDAPPARQLRSLRTGELIWQEPGSSLRAAADIPGRNLIAFADATSFQRTEDVIRLLSILTGEEQRRIDAGGYARHVAATADGTRVAAAVEGNYWRGIRVWSVDDGRLVGEIELDANPESIVPLSNPDHMAVVDFANNLRVFDLATGAQRHRIAHTRSADSIAAAVDADRAVTVASASLRVWDTRDGREIANRTTHGDASSVIISPDGAKVAYLNERPRTTKDGTEFPAVVIWPPQDGNGPVILPVEGISKLEFDPSGRYLALHGKGESVRLVDTDTLRTELTVRALRNGKLNDLAFTVDSRILLLRETGQYKTGNRSIARHSLRAFELSSDRELIRLDMGFRMLPVPGSTEFLYEDVKRRWRRVDPSQIGLDLELMQARPDRLAAASHSPRVLATDYWKRNLILDLANGQTTSLTTGDEPFNVLHGAIDPDGRFVALSLRERDWRDDSPGMIVIIDASDGTELARLDTQRAMWNVEFVDGGDAVIMSELRGHLPKAPDHSFAHWNWRTGSRRTLVDNNPVSYMAASRDGRRFATAEGTSNPKDEIDAPIGTLQLRIWDGAAGTELVRVPLEFDPSGVALSPAGHYVAVGNRNNVILFSTDDGRELARFHDPTAGVGTTGRDYSVDTNSRVISGRAALGFAAAGDTLVIAEASGVLLYNIADESTRRLRSVEPVKKMTISAGGDFVAMLGARFVSVWDVDSGRELIRTDVADTNNLTFGGMSGNALLTVGGDKIFQLHWRPEDLRSLACRAFQDHDWRSGRVRVIQQTRHHPCDSQRVGN